MRMAYQLLDRNRAGGRRLAEALVAAMDGVRDCASCRTFSDEEICAICRDSRRDGSQLCVVETPSDVQAIEQTGGYRGRYLFCAAICHRLMASARSRSACRS